MSFLDVFRPTPAKTLLEKQREHALGVARRTLPEFRREDVARGLYGYVTHEGGLYRVVRGVVADPKFSPATAFYVGADGSPVFLEPSR